MRTIKFRGKRTDTGEMVYGDLIHGVGSKHGRMYILPVTNIYPKGCHELDGWGVDPETVGQFTGLLDKNGKEIYEGDLIGFIKGVKTAQLSYTVKWFNGGFWLLDRGYGGKLEPQLIDLESFARSGGYQTMIVGNIHDNPELLKGDKE